MNRFNPIGTGLALAVTVGVLNFACAALVAVAPDSMIAVFQTWWHGLDVAMLAQSAPQMTLRSVATGVVTIMASAFIVGCLFAVAHNLVARKFAAK